MQAAVLPRGILPTGFNEKYTVKCLNTSFRSTSKLTTKLAD